MKAVRIHAHGDRDVLSVDDIAQPAPGPGELLVEVRATSINHLDLWMRRGLPGLDIPLPHVMGCDAAGVVVGHGDAATETLELGARVLVNPGLGCGHCSACHGGEPSLCASYRILGEHAPGTMAERIVVPRANLHRIPERLDFAAAASVPLVFLTAWRMLITRARLAPNEDVLILGASGGVGTAAVQIARLVGARVLATASTSDKADKLRELGCAEVLESPPADGLHKAVRELTAGRGADVVVNSVGQETWASSLKALANGGRLVTCGATSGPKAVTDLRHVFFRQLSIIGSTMGSGRELDAALRGLASGALRPVIDRSFEFATIRDAHEHVESRRVFGKVVVTP